MSDTQTKKKPDFKNLKLDNITTPPVAIETPKEETVVSGPKEGCWLNGIAIAEVSNQDFKDWIISKVPSANTWEDKEIDSAKKKEKIISSLAENYNGLLYLPKPKIKPKQYKH